MARLITNLQRDFPGMPQLPKLPQLRLPSLKPSPQWNSKAADILAQRQIDPLLRRDVVPFIQRIGASSIVLDFGAGVATYASLVANGDNRRVYAIDSSDAMLAKAAELFAGQTNIKFVNGKVGNLGTKIAAGTSSAVLAINIAQHLTETELPKMFSDAYKALREGGKMLVVVPSSIYTTFTTQVNEESAGRQITAGLDRVAARLKGEPFLGQYKDVVHIMRDELSFSDTVNQACFALEGGRIVSLDPEISGQKIDILPETIIYRKEGLMVTSEYYRPEEAYLEAAKSAGFKIAFEKDGEGIRRRTTQNTKLNEIEQPHYGSAYNKNNQYLTLVLQR